MQHAKLNELFQGGESEHDNTEIEPSLDNEATLALLEADVSQPRGGDPVAGIRNGVVGGLIIWSAIALILVLVA